MSPLARKRLSDFIYWFTISTALLDIVLSVWAKYILKSHDMAVLFAGCAMLMAFSAYVQSRRQLNR